MPLRSGECEVDPEELGAKWEEVCDWTSYEAEGGGWWEMKEWELVDGRRGCMVRGFEVRNSGGNRNGESGGGERLPD